MDSIANKLANALLENLFPHIIKNRDQGKPDWSWDVWLKTRDDVSIYSWWYDNDKNNRNGTFFVLHGFTSNCGNPGYWHRPKELADKYGFCLGEIDFRHHGKSLNKSPTFGMAESWDLEAALNYADSINAPKPYVLIGESLGGMAAQLVSISDPRIKAAVCLQTPGWPWDAIGNALKERKKVVGIPFTGTAINAAYGFKIMSAGDIRTKEPNPEHQPYVLYIMGIHDKYKIDHTKQVWDHWYSGHAAEYNKTPTQASNQRKWFIEGPWYHSDENWNQSIMAGEGLANLVVEFMDFVLDSN